MIRKYGLYVLLFVMIIFGFNFYLNQSYKDLANEEIRQVEENIRRAVANCYANEGFYPGDIKHLEDGYGLRIDYEHFHIYYATIGSNVYPDISVFRKG